MNDNHGPKLMLLVAALFLVVGTPSFQDASAAPASATCKKENCNPQKKNCLSTFKADFGTAQEACKTTKTDGLNNCGSDKQCKQGVKKDFTQCKQGVKLESNKNKGACNTGFKTCNRCCNTVTTGCSIMNCSDGVKVPGEECDDGNLTDGDGCRGDCTLELCGDNILDPGEECDDGNSVNGDGCSAGCTLPPPPPPSTTTTTLSTGTTTTTLPAAKCGDGKPITGEQCDEGTANGTTASCCSTDCTLRAASEACTDTDGNVCTTAGCDGVNGDCDQSQIYTPASTACPNTDGNDCTMAGCDGAGACDQAHVLVAASTPCTSAPNLECANPGCDGAGVCDPAHFLEPAGVQCRPSAGACDVAENCSGSSPDCPADGFEPGSTECRASAGVCDPAENCTGSSADCPADGKSTAQCRTSAGVCNPAEFCNGVDNNCPADAKSTAECRPAAGVCDVPESCNGVDNNCPADGFEPGSTACPDTDGNVCTTAGCDGAGACDQSQISTPASTACPNTDGNDCTTAGCDGAGVCDQRRVLVAASTPCTSAPDLECSNPGCNGAGVCDPLHFLEPASLECRASAAACDLPENCTGSSPDCPADSKSTAQCRASAGVCDPAESCDGVGNDCPADGKSTAQCRASAGVCDPVESCDGVGNDCPADGKSTAQCRASAGVCDPAESCDGVGNDCPADGFEPDSTTCPDTDGNVCTTAGCNGLGVCNQSHILPSGMACGNPANTDCTNPDTCDGAGNCLANHKPSSTPCPDIDGNVCTTAGCNGFGVCNQSHVLTPASYPCPDVDGQDCTIAGCNGLGVCNQTHVLVGNSTPCTDTDGNVCTTAGCNGTGVCNQSHILAPPSTLCGGGAGSCSTEHCDGAGTCVGESDCCAGLHCSEGSCDLLSFETGIPTGVGGVLQNFRCSNYSSGACVSSTECDFGTCLTYPGTFFCSLKPAILCTTNAQCQGTCAEVSSGNLPLNLEKGGLYTGAGLNSVPLPFPVPDQGLSYTEVTDCNTSTGELTLGPSTPGDVGSRHCTKGRTCTGGTNNGLHCVLAGDCPGGGTCTDNCVFGPPLPIPNAGTAATSVCAKNVIDIDGSGTAQCDGGDSDLSTPLRSVIYLTGDLFKSSTPPDLPGVQPCPICVPICSGGTKNGLPCRPDNPNRACAGGSKVGRPCTADAQCPSSTCAPARTEYSSCISGGGSCPNPLTNSKCLGGPNNGASCTPATSTSDLLGDAQDSYPTSHDCVNDPLASITDNIGGLPINFALTTGQIVWNAKDRPNGARVFCGFCRDVTGTGSFCFEGSLSGGCPVASPPADGNAVPCTSDADCGADGTDDQYESCVQRDPGAFSEAGATRITVTGAPPNECLGDGGLHETELVSLFCVPPTFDATVDAAGDLPGPGAALLAGDAQLD